MKRGITILVLVISVLLIIGCTEPKINNKNLTEDSDIKEVKYQKIIFIDNQAVINGKLIEGEYSGPMIDFPTYEYDKEINTLRSLKKLSLNESIIAIYGSGVSLEGVAGSGAASSLHEIYNLPYEGRGFKILKINPDETVQLEYNNESIILKHGEEWVKTTSRTDKNNDGSAELTTTETIINYGLSNVEL